MKYTFGNKLYIVSIVKGGYPISRISQESHLNENKILEWVRLYDIYGEEGLRKRPNIRATPEFKEQLVREILEKGIPLAHIIIKYRVSRTAMESWVRSVRKNGYPVLYNTKCCGRHLKDMGRPKKKEPQTELDKLQAENLRLRAENALLKKVKALVEEQEARARLNGLKPSKD